MNEIIATLMFDSWSDRIPECRSNRPEDRHLIYEGEGIILDLLLKQDGDGARIHVGGQVLSEDAVEQEYRISLFAWSKADAGPQPTRMHSANSAFMRFRVQPSTSASRWASGGFRFAGWLRSNRKVGKSFPHSRLAETE